jgi:tetratricopeptide (TPR) repeat protein
MHSRILLSLVFLIALGSVLARVARGAAALSTEDGKAPCCREVDTDIARLQKNAERLYAQFKPKDAANELQKILQRDGQNFEALAKLARAHIDIGDMISESSQDAQDRKMKEYRTAEDYARKAIKVNPNSTWGYFYVAASLGSMAMLSPVAKQIDMAGEIRGAVEKAIALDSQNGFAYHVYGVWHRKMSEIGKASRMVVSVFYGRSIPSGSLEKSIEYLRKAVALNPTVIVSRLELARSYAAVEEWSLARQSLAAVRELPIKFSDDAKHKEKAEELLDEIKER